jgi:hypothetical protein
MINRRRRGLGCVGDWLYFILFFCFCFCFKCRIFGVV